MTVIYNQSFKTLLGSFDIGKKDFNTIKTEIQKGLKNKFSCSITPIKSGFLVQPQTIIIQYDDIKNEMNKIISQVVNNKDKEDAIKLLDELSASFDKYFLIH